MQLMRLNDIIRHFLLTAKLDLVSVNGSLMFMHLFIKWYFFCTNSLSSIVYLRFTIFLLFYRDSLILYFLHNTRKCSLSTGFIYNDCLHLLTYFYQSRDILLILLLCLLSLYSFTRLRHPFNCKDCPTLLTTFLFNLETYVFKIAASGICHLKGAPFILACLNIKMSF